MPAAQIKINGVVGSNDNLPINVLVQLSNNNAGGEVTFAWTILAQPTGAADALSNPAIVNPTFTPKKEGTYLLRLDVNGGEGSGGFTDIQIAGIRQIKTPSIRIPAAGETIQDNGAVGWAAPVDVALIDVDSLLADGNVIVGVAGAGGLVTGNVVKASGTSILKAGLPGQESVPTFTLAHATSAVDVGVPLFALLGGVDGSMTPANGAVVRARLTGQFLGVTGAGSTFGQAVYVTDAGVLSLTPGTHPRKVGAVSRAGVGDFDVLFDGGAVPSAGDPDTQAYFGAGGGLTDDVHATMTLALWQLQDAGGLNAASVDRVQRSLSVGEGSTALGLNSVAEGNTCVATNPTDHAEGYGSTAIGDPVTGSAHAEGFFTTANGQAAHAEGIGSQAVGSAAHAEGDGNAASGDGAHAEGSGTQALADQAHAEGNTTTANGLASHAEGQGTQANGLNSHAEGNNTTAGGNYSHTEGQGTQANGVGAHAEGLNPTIAIGDGAHAEGHGTSASANHSHAEGASTQALGVDSHAEGNTSIANHPTDHAEGNGTAATGDVTLGGAHAEGYQTTATGLGAHAEGEASLATAEAAHAEGIGGTHASGIASHAEGDGTVANARSAHAEGTLTAAHGLASHAEGSATQAVGNTSHAEGQSSAARDPSSHAEGNGTNAFGQAAHAEGLSTTTNGSAAHAEGESTTANGIDSHAEGKLTQADGLAAHAEGLNAYALRDGQHAHSSGPGASAASGPGQSQRSYATMAGDTPGSAPGESVELLFGQSPGEQLILEDGKGYAIVVTAVARGTIAGNKVVRSFKTTYAFRRDAGLTVLAGTGTQELLGDAAAASWTLAATVGVAPDRVAVTFTTGATTSAARVTAEIKFIEIYNP